MMYDRFSAQLRQHLLEAADERPADGQLAAVVERVAVTAQRPSIVARLTWFPGRVGPFPSAALRYGLVLALVAATAAAAIFVGGSVRPPSTVFEGTWTSTDPADHSTQTLVVGAGTTPTVHFEDDFATGDACVADPVKRFTADGTGSITGARIETVFPDGGGCGLRLVEVPMGHLDYDAATDTLVGEQGLTWTRVPGDPRPTQRPSSPPVPTTTPAPEPTTSPRPEEPTFSLGPDPSSCMQFDHEATYTANSGALPVSITVPATPSSPWVGLPDEFELLNAPCEGNGPVWINAVLVAHVYADSCHWKSSSVEAPTAPDVVSQLQVQEGHDTSAATDTRVGPFRATRLDLSVPADFDDTTCDDGVLGLWETSAGMRIIDPGTTIQVYVAEVDGVTLVVTAGYHPEDATPDLLAEIDAMLATLRVDF